jgi:hypothetical protein
MAIAPSPEYDDDDDEWIDMDAPIEAIAPTTPKAPNVPNPNNRPSNKPTTPPQNESLYDRIKRLNAPLTEFCQAQYQAARYA